MAGVEGSGSTSTYRSLRSEVRVFEGLGVQGSSGVLGLCLDIAAFELSKSSKMWNWGLGFRVRLGFEGFGA